MHYQIMRFLNPEIKHKGMEISLHWISICQLCRRANAREFTETEL